MKKVKQTTVLLSIFAMVLYRNNLTFPGAIVIILACIVPAILIVTISEVYGFEDKDKQYLTPKKTSMEVNDNSLDG